jgi:hypothetical protein
VREESHLDDMREAIRGDFERLAERRGEQELLRPSRLEVAGEEPELESEPESEHEPHPEPEIEPGPERTSWLARLFSA